MNINPLQVHPEAECVSINGKVRRLTRMEWDMLEILRNNIGRTLSRSFLIERLYGSCEPECDSVRVIIARLRQKLEGSSYHIPNSRGEGYRLEKVEPDDRTPRGRR